MDFNNVSRPTRTERLGMRGVITSATINEHIDRLFDDRYTCRNYDPSRSIPPKDWRSIIHAAWRSPSSMGFEPWQFVRVTTPWLREEIMRYAWGSQNRCENASEFLLLYGRTARDLDVHSSYLHDLLINVQHGDEASMEERRQKISSFIGEDAGTRWEPELVEAWVQKQVYIALGNMMTVAAMLGIDSTPIEGFNKQQMTKVLEDNGVLDTRHFQLACCVAFGYSLQPGKTKVRRPIDQVYREV